MSSGRPTGAFKNFHNAPTYKPRVIPQPSPPKSPDQTAYEEWVAGEEDRAYEEWKNTPRSSGYRRAQRDARTAREYDRAQEDATWRDPTGQEPDF